jgi:hypothetical protein
MRPLDLLVASLLQCPRSAIIAVAPVIGADDIDAEADRKGPAPRAAATSRLTGVGADVAAANVARARPASGAARRGRAPAALTRGVALVFTALSPATAPCRSPPRLLTDLAGFPGLDGHASA